MADMVQTNKKIALLHRYPADRIKETNAAFPYLKAKGIDVITFRSFNRMTVRRKAFKSILWGLYAFFRVIDRGYTTLYLDDSFPFYPILIRLACPKAKIVLRLGDLHLMYYTKGWLYKALHKIEKVGWKSADKILVISEAMREYLASEGYESSVVPDPVEADDFLPDPKIKGENNIVMFHGLITRNKNLDIMLEAARRLPQVYFWVVGDGPDKNRLQSFAPHNVVFTGWHSYASMNVLINNCTIGLALRANTEGNQYVVTSPYLQYAACGKPCLVTKRKVYGNYRWQFETIEEMVEMIEYLLKHPEEGKKLRKKVLHHHKAQKVAEQIWNHLSQ